MMSNLMLFMLSLIYKISMEVTDDFADISKVG
jgi:hypothetical protein